MKIFIAGGAGMLGTSIAKEAKKKFDVINYDLDDTDDGVRFMDFRDFEIYNKNVNDYKPDYLFHIGAHTNLEYCEDNWKDAYLTNTESVEHAIKISNNLKIPLIYISTAGIFSGEKEFFSEIDLPEP